MSGARLSVPVRFVFHGTRPCGCHTTIARVSRFMNRKHLDFSTGVLALNEYVLLPWAKRIAGAEAWRAWRVLSVGTEGTGAQTVHLD